MKITTLSLLLCIWTIGDAFHVQQMIHRRQTKILETTKLASASDDYLEQCVEEWNDLEKQLNTVKETKTTVRYMIGS